MGLAVILGLAALTLSSSGCGKKEKNIREGSFIVNSDCVSPAREVSVRTLNDQIVSGATSYLDFGFPNSVVKLGQDNSGYVGSIQRNCVNTYGDTEGDAWVFSCFDAGAYSCSILIRPN
ncbi:MAG: hypothetical protein HC902_07830 [Calothrix sp. SM1_5_4]|nr:hypothetical protein [Calothrix sp. SM1_5_4]